MNTTTDTLMDIAARRVALELMFLEDPAYTTDPAAMDWALATAGHLFDSHELWDYSLISDEDHVHRCTGHRHEGPNTRGFRL